MFGEPLRLAVEKHLRAAWGGEVVLDAGDQGGLSERQHVFRFHVRVAPDGSPSSVVVKRPRLREGEKFDPDAAGPSATLFFTEWACLRLLTELGPDAPSPRLYCGDARDGLLMMEDLGSGERLDNALLGSDSIRAAESLIALFETLGRLHASTFGKRARFEAILRELGRPPVAQDVDAEAHRQAAVQDALDRIDVRPHRHFFDEIAQVARRTRSAALETLVHGDPCPDNCQWVGNRVRLLDFEHGRFDGAFTDGCYARIHFPTCWCTSRLPEDVVISTVEAYRRELVRGLPHLADDQEFERAMIDASILWAWGTFARWHMPDVLSKDQEWGLVTVRQRIVFRFGRLLEMLDRHGGYAGIAETTRRTHEKLSARWSDLPDMPLYPAFLREPGE